MDKSINTSTSTAVKTSIPVTQKISLGVMIFVALSAGLAIIAAMIVSVEDLFEQKSVVPLKIIFTVEVPDFEKQEIVHEGVMYTRLSFKQEPTLKTEKIGLPELPLLKKFIALPEQAKNIIVTATPSGLEKFFDLLLYPVPKQVVEEDEQGFVSVKEEFFQVTEAYQSEDFFPEAYVELSTEGYIRSQRLLAINVQPFQYQAAQKILQKAKSLNITLQYELDSMVSEKPEKLDQMAAVVRGLVENKTSIPAGPEPQTSSVNLISNLLDPTNAIDYLIITHSDFSGSAELNDFAAYRAEADDLRIGITKVSDIYAQFSGPTNEEKIQKLVAYAYASWQVRPSYLLFVGDVDRVPTHVEENPGDPTYDINNDDWFAYVSGNDEWADLAVGRMSVSNVSEISNIYQKINNYETGAINVGDWHKHASVIRGATGSGGYNSGEQIKNRFLPSSFTMTDFECSSPPISLFDANLVYYHGHGYYNEWWRCLSDLSGLPMSEPLVITKSCLTANLTHNSIGENMVKMADRGAVAYYGFTSTVASTDQVDNYLFQNTLDNFKYTLGQSVLYAEAYGDGKNGIIIGDPALHTFSYRRPANQPDLTLSSSDVTYSGNSNTVKTKVTNIGDTNADNVPVQTFYDDPVGTSHPMANFTVSVPAHSSAETTVEVPPESQPPDGEFFITAKIDPENLIPESFKLNNRNGRSQYTAAESLVIFLSHDGLTPLYGKTIKAYGNNNTLLSTVSTDINGQAKFNIAEGIPVRFEAWYSSGAGNNSLAGSNELTPAPYQITFVMPTPSRVIYKNYLGEVIDGCYLAAFDPDTTTYLLGSGKTGQNFYFQEGLEFRFSIRAQATCFSPQYINYVKVYMAPGTFTICQGVECPKPKKNNQIQYPIPYE